MKTNLIIIGLFLSVLSLSAQSHQTNLSDNLSAYNDSVTASVSEEPVMYPYLTKVDRKFYKTSDGQYLNTDELVEFLNNHCDQASRIWRHGDNLRTAGWTLIGLGVGLNMAGNIYKWVAGHHTSLSLSGCIVGGLCEIACIPTLIIGYNYKGRAVKKYNVHCANIQEIALNVGVSHDGLGVVLKF